MKKLIIFLFLCLNIGINTTQAQSENTSNQQNLAEEVGFLRIDTQVDSLFLVINEQFDSALKIASTDSIAISPGNYEIRLVKKYFRDLQFSVDIEANQTTSLEKDLRPFKDVDFNKHFSSYPRIVWEAPVVIKGDPDARLYVDGSYIGTGIGRITQRGSITVTSELPDGQKSTKTFSTRNSLGNFHVEEFYQRPAKKQAKMLSFIPGASQIYQDDTLKGYTLMASVAIGGGLSYYFHNQFKSEYSAFKNTKASYLSADDPVEAFELGNLADQQFDDAESASSTRDLLLYGTLAVYMYNIIDGFIKPDIGYRKLVEIDPYLEYRDAEGSAKGISISYHF